MKRSLLSSIGFILACTAILLISCSFGSGRTATEGAATPPSITPENTVGPHIDLASYQPRPYDDKAEQLDIPGGAFLMGNGKPGAPVNETPTHSVTLAAYRIYSHEVTNKMYQLCVNTHQCMYPGLAGTDVMSKYSDPAYADFPVVGVDWHMARDYCEFTGGRLPTEAEWEFAARGTKNFTYPWGENLPTCDLLNMKACLAPGHPVAGGSYPDGKSPFGLYDMAGNVWEWTNDWYAEDAYSTAGIYGPNNGTEKTLRGGGYLSRPESVSTTVRLSSIPDRAYDDVGFRCVRTDTIIPPETVVPPERHDPYTPPGGSEEPGDPPLETTLLEIAEAPCVGDDNVLHAHFKIMITGSPEIDSVELLIEDPVTHINTAASCMLWPVEAGHYQIECNRPLPPSLTGDFPSTWLNMTLRVNLVTPAASIDFITALEAVRCADPGVSAGWGLTTTLSCPDSSGVSTLSVTGQHYSEAPDFINYAFEGWDMSTCTSFYAENFTCSGTLVGLAPHQLDHWFKLPSFPDVTVTGYNIYEPEDCTSETWHGWVGCNGTDGYELYVSSVNPHPDGVTFSIIGGEIGHCSSPGPTAWACTFTLEEPHGSDVVALICPNQSDGTPGDCIVQHMPFPDEPCSPEGGGWRISAVGCADTTRIYFTLETGLPWLIPGAAYTYSAADISVTYACEVYPTTPGKLYCVGNRPDVPGPMQVCIQQDGALAPTCNTFSDYGTWVAAVPACSEELSKVSLTSYGCDPSTGRFFCIIEAAVTGVSFDEYRVSTNISELTCTLLASPPDRIYCYSGWHPDIVSVRFAETDPSADVSVNWSISPEACPTLPPPALRQCTDFTTIDTCNAQYTHGCKWAGTYCSGTYH